MFCRPSVQRCTLLVLVVLMTCEANAIGQVDSLDRADRFRFAREFRESISRLNQLVPNLTPDQVAYLEKEESEIAGIEDANIERRRRNTLVQSKEFHLRLLKKTCEDAMFWIDFLTYEGNSENTELLGWMMLVSELMHPGSIDGPLEYLQELRALSKADVKSLENLPDGFGYGNLLASRAKTAMDEIVIPLQRRAISRKTK